MVPFWCALQGAVEYGVLTGSQAGGGGPRGLRGITSWASDHAAVLLAVGALLLLLGLFRAARRR